LASEFPSLESQLIQSPAFLRANYWIADLAYESGAGDDETASWERPIDIQFDLSCAVALELMLLAVSAAVIKDDPAPLCVTELIAGSRSLPLPFSIHSVLLGLEHLRALNGSNISSDPSKELAQLFSERFAQPEMECSDRSLIDIGTAMEFIRELVKSDKLLLDAVISQASSLIIAPSSSRQPADQTSGRVDSVAIYWLLRHSLDSPRFTRPERSQLFQSLLHSLPQLLDDLKAAPFDSVSFSASSNICSLHRMLVSRLFILSLLSDSLDRSSQDYDFFLRRFLQFLLEPAVHSFHALNHRMDDLLQRKHQFDRRFDVCNALRKDQIKQAWAKRQVYEDEDLEFLGFKDLTNTAESAAEAEDEETNGAKSSQLPARAFSFIDPSSVFGLLLSLFQHHLDQFGWIDSLMQTPAQTNRSSVKSMAAAIGVATTQPNQHTIALTAANAVSSRPGEACFQELNQMVKQRADTLPPLILSALVRSIPLSSSNYELAEEVRYRIEQPSDSFHQALRRVTVSIDPWNVIEASPHSATLINDLINEAKKPQRPIK
jgi:hypothetical protein